MIRERIYIQKGPRSADGRRDSEKQLRKFSKATTLNPRPEAPFELRCTNAKETQRVFKNQATSIPSSKSCSGFSIDLKA